MRLGDLDALKEVITANHYLLSSRNNSIDYGMFTTGIIQAIDNAPTINPCNNCDLYFKAMTKEENKPLNWLDRCDDDYLSDN